MTVSGDMCGRQAYRSQSTRTREVHQCGDGHLHLVQHAAGEGAARLDVDGVLPLGERCAAMQRRLDRPYPGGVPAGARGVDAVGVPARVEETLTPPRSPLYHGPR